MKAVIKKNKTVKQEIKYPYIGVNINSREPSYVTYVLFTDKLKGVCLKTTQPGNTNGEYYKHWNEDMFTPFTGTIELSND